MLEPTIYDVSKLSGVSTATVSRTFAEPHKVRESTRRKVLEAAELLHYSPNAIAQAMARQRADKIAYLICKKGANILDEFYARICDSIMREVNKTEFHLLISTAEDWNSAGFARRKQIEGVILGGSATEEMIAELQGQNIAVVLVNSRAEGMDVPCVVSDEEGGIRACVEHLMDRGHRRIAMLAGRFGAYIARTRYQAFLDVMEEKGLTDREVVVCENDVASAAEAAMPLLRREDRPTAVIASSDAIAAGVYKAAGRLGLSLPRDMAVTGIDDSSICSMLEPELTSVHIDCQRMGTLCVELLKARLEGKQTPMLTVVPPRLVVRSST